MPFSGETSSLGSEASSIGVSEITRLGEVGASAGMGCSWGPAEVVLAMGAVMGEGSLPGDTAGATVAAPAWPEERDSKSGHQLFSTSSGSF